MLFVRALLLYVTLALGWSVANAADPTLVLVDAGNPPFMYNASGVDTAGGVYPALLLAAFARMGMPLVVKAVPWKRAMQELEHGVAGVGGIYRNEERASKFDYSEPLIVERIAVFYNSQRPIEFRNLHDLFGKRIGVIRGWSYGDELDLARKNEQLVVEEVNGDQQNFRKLASGRLDAVLAIVESGERMLEEGAGELAYVKMATTLLASNPAYLAFSKKQNQVETLKQFNKTLAAMKKDGSLDKLFQQELAR